ncbi:MAG: 4-(cytidine 5'-diphospho)-2-C-methyl-D-erythritol kinase [Pseudomonadota bacterium]
MPAEPIVEAAPAKLNLDLYVERRRPDGYHDLDSIVTFTTFGDRLTLWPAGELRVDVEGPLADALTAAGETLVAQAIVGAAAAFDRSPDVRVRLEKHIPLAAGLGGGSADAAAALRALARHWDVRPDDARLAAVAASLGADVPVCLHGRPVRMRGTGELLQAAPDLPPLEVVLVNPGVPCPTGAVYAALPPDDLGLAPERPGDDERVPRWLVGGRNAMERAARAVQPHITGALDRLAATGPVVTRLCGSGATVFGVYADAATADEAAARLRAVAPATWAKRTTTLGS